MAKINIEEQIMEDLKLETSKISQKVLNVLEREGIAGIIVDTDTKIFWFELYSRGNDCPIYAYKWLKSYIKRKYDYDYYLKTTNYGCVNLLNVKK